MRHINGSMESNHEPTQYTGPDEAPSAGMVTLEDFEIAQAELPKLADGEALARVKYLSLDPYMRPMMDRCARTWNH